MTEISWQKQIVLEKLEKEIRLCEAKHVLLRVSHAPLKERRENLEILNELKGAVDELRAKWGLPPAERVPLERVLGQSLDNK